MQLNKILLAFIFLLSIVLFVSCSEEETTAPPITNNSNAPLAKLSDIQVKIFDSCASANCHSSTSMQGNLDLSSGQSFANLVGVQSVLHPQFKRVEAGSGGNSMLLKILKGELNPRMPLNRTPLSNDVIDSIEVWIERGALNN